MNDRLKSIVDLEKYPIDDLTSPLIKNLVKKCKDELEQYSCSTIPNFILPKSVVVTTYINTNERNKTKRTNKMYVPEKYLEAAMKDPEKIFETAQEMVKIVLDSEKKAAQARLILASMVDNEHYIQRTRYVYNGEEIEVKEQKIETEELVLQLKAMIEIVKQWETFDMEAYQKEMEAALAKAMKS